MSNQHHTPTRRGNIISRYVDPVKNANSMEGHVLMSETIAKLVAVIITSIGFFIWGKDVAAQYTDWAVAHWATGILFAVIAAWITDFAFSHFLENSMFQFLAFWKFDWFGASAQQGPYITYFLRPMRWLVVTIIVAALLWADWTSVYTLRSPIANAKKENVERVDFSSLRKEQQRAITATIAPVDAEIKQVRADIVAAERNAVAANTALAKLAAEGNSWAKGQLAAKKAKATKAYKKRLESLQEQRDKAYTSATTLAAREQDIALTDDATAQQTEAESKTAITTLFTQFGIGSKLLTIFLRLFLIINFLINTPNWDANRDGRIDGSDVTASASGAAGAAATPPPAHTTGHSPAFAHRRRAGFKRHDDDHPEQPQSRTGFMLGGPIVLPTVPEETLWHSVPQHSAPEQPKQNSRAGTVPAIRATGVLADIKYWEKLSCLYLKRSFTSQREQYKRDNATRFEAYRTMLEALGITVERGSGYALTFRHPDKYNTSDDAMRIVESQYTILKNLRNGIEPEEAVAP